MKSRQRFTSLRWRLTFVIGGVVAVMLFGASFLAYVSAERELNNQVNEFLLTRSRETEEGLTVANLPVNSDLAIGIQFGTINALQRADASIQILAPDSNQAFLISGSVLPLAQTDFDIAASRDESVISRATFDRVTDNGDRYRCLLYTSPSPRDQRGSRMPSSA